MALIEPLGVRILGVEFKETHLEAISKALIDTIWEPEEIVGKIAEGAIRFGDLLVEDEKYLSDTDPETLRDLFKRSGLVEQKYFFNSFLDNLSKRQTLINLLSGLGSVTAESGSLRLKFRNRARKIGELKVNLKKIWTEIRKRETEIKNSFNHLAEFAKARTMRSIDRIENWIVHIGLYAAAFVLVILSLWYSVAFSVASGLSTLASNLFNILKAAFPIISFVIFIACIIYDSMEAVHKFNDAYDAARRFLEKA